MKRCAGAIAWLLLHAPVLAHGGQYRGGPGALPPPLPLGLPGAPSGPAAPPWVPPPPPPGAPAAPVWNPTPSTTPGTGTGPAAATVTWQTWWEFNKEPYLVSRIRGEDVPLTGSDDFYLGARRPAHRADLLAPTDTDRSDRIVPALVALLDAERNRDVQSACLIALGKVGCDGPGVDLEAALAARIARDDQEVRESAALALGIGGRPAALPLLVGLVQDDRDGKKLVDRATVHDRTRAFAAFGLGLLAHRAADPALSQRAHDALAPLLSGNAAKGDRDVRTAAICGLGVMRADPARSADKRLAWLAVERLLDYFTQDLGAGDEAVQAHAPIAIARLLGRGDTPLHRRCKEQFAAELDTKNPRGGAILQSCAIALGMLVLPAEQQGADEAFVRTLRRQYEKAANLSVRWFSALAVGRIGGAGNREWLLRAYQRGNRAVERPWLALALGIACEAAARGGQPDAVVAQLLLDDLVDEKADELRTALAVAVGLTGHRPAAPALLKLLREHESDERTAGYLCIGLGLLGDVAVAPQLTAVLERSLHRPFLLQQCAVALGCLGDRGANDKLVGLLQKADGVAVLAALAAAIGRIGDRRAIDALIEASRDRELTKLARAFVAAALGGIGAEHRLPWSVPLSVDCNFLTQIDALTNGQTGVLDIL